MIPPLPTDDTAALPTFENRLSAYLHAHGVDLAPGEFVVREARLIRELAGLGLDEEMRADLLSCVEQNPQVLLGDIWRATPITKVNK